MLRDKNINVINKLKMLGEILHQHDSVVIWSCIVSAYLLRAWGSSREINLARLPVRGYYLEGTGLSNNPGAVDGNCLSDTCRATWASTFTRVNPVQPVS